MRLVQEKLAGWKKAGDPVNPAVWATNGFSRRHVPGGDPRVLAAMVAVWGKPAPVDIVNNDSCGPDVTGQP